MAHMKRIILNRPVAQCLTSFMPISVVRKVSSHSTNLKEITAKKIVEHREVVKNFREKYGNTVIGQITVDQVYSGMRNMKCFLTETSELDPVEGIRFRNLSIPQCQELLPKAPGGEETLPEGIFWLLVTGDVPTYQQVKTLSQQWAKLSELPPHVVTLLKGFPPTLHPVEQLAIAVEACNTESVFNKAYREGVPESRYWEFIYDDAMSLIAKMPSLASHIYRNANCKGSSVCAADPAKDFTHNFASMLGHENPLLIEFLRLFLSILSDHEGGNACAHTAHLVGSALADPFVSFAAGMKAFAGPIHGAAIQEVLAWVTKLKKRYGQDVTDAQIREFAWETLNSGQVIPGYGHAVLRKPDPRFTSQLNFALKHLPSEPLVRIISTSSAVVPPILREYGKVKSPWPNSDLASGVLLQSLGLKDPRFSTVVFAVSRVIGVMASLIWSRALTLPIEEPSTVRTEELVRHFGGPKTA